MGYTSSEMTTSSHPGYIRTWQAGDNYRYYMHIEVDFGKGADDFVLDESEGVATARRLVAELNKFIDANTHAASKHPLTPKVHNLTDQARTIFQHMKRAGDISAREAMADHAITSATLARRICDIEVEGFEIERTRKINPVTLRKYTRYSLAA